MQFDSQRNGFVESEKKQQTINFLWPDKYSTYQPKNIPTYYVYIFFGKTKIDGKYMIMMIIVEKYKWEREEGELAKDSVRQRKTLQGNVA